MLPLRARLRRLGLSGLLWPCLSGLLWLRLSRLGRLRLTGLGCGWALLRGVGLLPGLVGLGLARGGILRRLNGVGCGLLTVLRALTGLLGTGCVLSGGILGLILICCPLHALLFRRRGFLWASLSLQAGVGWGWARGRTPILRQGIARARRTAGNHRQRCRWPVQRGQNPGYSYQGQVCQRQHPGPVWRARPAQAGFCFRL